MGPRSPIFAMLQIKLLSFVDLWAGPWGIELDLGFRVMRPTSDKLFKNAKAMFGWSFIRPTR